jgi:hydrogenase maturation protease
MTPWVLVAGIGNIFFGDDGFGVEVANRLGREPLPDGVRVEDFGIRAVHLAYELLDGCDALVMIDAVPLGEAPGTVALLKPDAPSGRPELPAVDAHTMTPDTVLAVFATLGGTIDDVYVIGCEPESVAPGIGLSAPVEAAVAAAMDLARDLVAELIDRGVGAAADQSSRSA